MGCWDRALERPLLATYDDSWVILQWAAFHFAGGPGPWLSEHGDFDRITIVVGNIVHNMAMWDAAKN